MTASTDPKAPCPLAVIGRAAGLLDLTAPSREPEAAAELLAVGAAVAELVDAAKGMRAVTGGGNVCTVTESLAAYHRLDAALAKFGGGL